jgi:hypothetical protein
MTRGSRITSWIGAVLMTSIAVAAAAAVNSAPSVAGEVKVTVKYTGKGEVDASHRIWVWLFDTPDIGAGAIPVAEMALERNGGTADFADVVAKEVWIAIAYDEKGGFLGQAPPPSGSPITLYGTDAGPPASVTPGDKAVVSVTFDDSQRMP